MSKPYTIAAAGIHVDHGEVASDGEITKGWCLHPNA